MRLDGAEDRIWRSSPRVQRQADSPHLGSRLVRRILDVAPQRLGDRVAADLACSSDNVLRRREARGRAEQDETGGGLRIGEGVLLRDEAAERDAEDDGRVDAE